MGSTSSIEWTDATWNPVSGCTKVSPGCDHCYAERVTERFHGKGSFAQVVLHPDRLDLPLHWRKPRKVFVNSMSDLFHDDVPSSFIAAIFDVMRKTPQHTYQILTKRHARMRSLMRSGVPGEGWPLPNVWLGVSVESQQWADIRIPSLLDTPAAVRFLSCEPLLGPVDLKRVPDAPLINGGGVDWVIVGGESGPNARPMHPQWARDIRDQCVSAGVPFLFKQFGEWGPARGWRGPDHHITIDGRLFAPGERLGPDHMMQPAAIHRWGKKTAGRELDGRTWDEYPEVA